ncbi:MAG: hypothetical protein OER95_13925, partial [Acidimicrobiia bacterium]|nr:hypothetical protein [Acidimicrobiia bacterium]
MTMADDPTIPVSVTGQPQTFAESPTSVMVEVRGPDRALVDRRMIRVNAPPTPMGLAGPGLHAIRATLGSGVVLEEDIVFEGGTVPGVTFNLFDQSPHESLQRVATVHPLAGQPAGILTASSYVSAWARLFERHGSEWRPVTPPLDLRASEWNDDAVRYGLQLGRRQYVLQVGAPGIAPIMTALPALGTTDVVFQPVLEPDGRPGFRLSVVPASEEAATLLGYLGRGEVRAIESMLEEDTATGRLGSARPDDIELAELVLYEKLSDPNTAALGGYHLLRVGDLERLHNWPANLAEWMDWMSDGSIIRGWQLLRGGGRRRRRETPRRRFLEAVERGLPVYAEGLRLLIDGLKVLNHQDPDDEAVAAAIELMGEYAAATDWSHAVLSFSGSGPSSPSRQVELKAMAGEAGVLMLHSVTTEDLVARRLLRPGTRLSVNRPRFSMSS